MEQEEAIKLLVSAVMKAQKSGVYTLEESYLLHQAIQAFVVKKEDEKKE